MGRTGTWTGLAAVTKALGAFISGFEEVRTLADEYRLLDDERVLVATQFSARGGGSGLALTGKGVILFHIREGKVTRIVRYWEPDCARHECFVMDASVSVKTAETAELDENQACPTGLGRSGDARNRDRLGMPWSGALQAPRAKVTDFAGRWS
jgi:hypothetical protein